MPQVPSSCHISRNASKDRIHPPKKNLPHPSMPPPAPMLCIAVFVFSVSIVWGSSLDVATVPLFDNTANLSFSVTATTAGSPLSPSNQIAAFFTTGSTAYYLHEVDLYAKSSGTVVVEVVVSLVLDAFPHSVVASAAVSTTLGSTGGAVRIKLSDAFVAAAGTRYALVLLSGASPSIQLLASGSSGGTAVVTGGGCSSPSVMQGRTSTWAWSAVSPNPGLRIQGRISKFNPSIGFDNTSECLLRRDITN